MGIVHTRARKLHKTPTYQLFLPIYATLQENISPLSLNMTMRLCQRRHGEAGPDLSSRAIQTIQKFGDAEMKKAYPLKSCKMYRADINE